MLLPIMNDLIKKYLSPFIAKLSEINKVSMESAIKIAGIVAAIGPLILILGKVLGVIGKLTKQIPLLTAKNIALFGIIGLVVFALGKLFIENENFRKSVLELLKAVAKLVTSAVKPFLNLINSLIPTIGKVATVIGKMVAWSVKAITAEIDWLDKTKLLDFALFLLGTTLAVMVVAFIGSIWSAVTALGAFILSAGTKAVAAIGKFVLTLMVNAMFALGSFKLALASVCIGLAAMEAGVILAFYVFTNWDIMNGVRRVIAIIGVLTVVLLGAALAFGVFHSAWSLGLAVAGIIAGVVAVVAAVESAKACVPDGDKVDTQSIANNFAGSIGGYAKGGAPANSSLFYSNEFGNPELVANFGGGTGVANNEMIVQAIESATYNGMSRAISQMPTSGDGNKIAVIEINGREFARATFSDIKAEGKRRGDW